MRSQVAWGKIGIGVSMCLSLAACDGAAKSDQNDAMQVQTEPTAPPANPCIDSEVLSGLKQDIKD